MAAMLKLAAAGLALTATRTWASPLNKRAVLDECLAAAKVPTDTPGSDEWKLDAAPFNVRTPYRPIAIAVPTTTEHIQDAVRCGVKAGVKVTAKCGGHSYANFGFGGEDGHLMLELDRMNKVTLDKTTNIASVQGGSRLGHVASVLYEEGKRGISHGTCPGVGVGGHVLHGGYGMSSHTKGLALDWLVGVTVVLANSTVVEASDTQNPEIYWAIKGAGSSIGVVSEFRFNTFEVPTQVTHFLAVLAWNEKTAPDYFKIIQDYTENTMSNGMNARLFITPQFANLEGMFYGDKEELLAELDPLLKKINGNLQMSETTDWPGQLSHFGGGLDLDQTHPYNKQENIYSSSLYTDKLTDAQILALTSYWYGTAKKVKRQWYLQIDLHGGKTSAIAQKPAGSSSYSHREKLFLYQFYDRVDVKQKYPADGFALLGGFVANITHTMKKTDYGMYFNYPDPKLDQASAQSMYWGPSLSKLQAIKHAVDPNEVFYLPQSVRPAKGAVANPGDKPVPEAGDKGQDCEDS